MSRPPYAPTYRGFLAFCRDVEYALKPFQRRIARAHFDPEREVIAILPRVTDVSLSVEGYVVPALANGQTAVTLQQGGVVQRATVPDANGRFMLSPLPAAGTYDLVITAAGRVTAVMTGVPVTTTALTKINLATAPIDLAPGLPTAKASGSAKTSATPDASSSAAPPPPLPSRWAATMNRPIRMSSPNTMCPSALSGWRKRR